MTSRRKPFAQDIYGDLFQVMSSDMLRTNPINADLLLVTAYYLKTPAGAPADSVGLNSTFFLYEVLSKRRTILGPSDSYNGGRMSAMACKSSTAKAPGKVPLSTGASSGTPRISPLQLRRLLCDRQIAFLGMWPTGSARTKDSTPPTSLFATSAPLTSVTPYHHKAIFTSLFSNRSLASLTF